MRMLTPLAAAVVALPVGVGAPVSPPQLTVPCADAIDQTTSGNVDGYRVVLDVVSVPSRRIDGVATTAYKPWPFFAKFGLLIRAGAPPVRVTVPKPWRRRAAISWGNRPGNYSSLRVATCGTAAAVWNGYAGGVSLRTRSACVPLTFRVGTRRTTVRFALGRPCPKEYAPRS